jgi:hypothetical protein
MLTFESRFQSSDYRYDGLLFVPVGAAIAFPCMASSRKDLERQLVDLTIDPARYVKQHAVAGTVQQMRVMLAVCDADISSVGIG